MFRAQPIAVSGDPLCRYGGSKLSFRGPQTGTNTPFCVVLGGSETFGKSVVDPYPACLARLLGQPVVNLGCAHAGLDALVADPAVMSLCTRARLTVVQVLAAQHLTNRYYAVHPRRNDRFVRAKAPLAQLYPEVDFTAFHFTGHMLSALCAVSAERFALVRQEMQRAWIARMRELAQHLPGPSILLWLGPHAPPTVVDRPDAHCIDIGLLDQARALFTDYVQVSFPTVAQGAQAGATLPDARAHDCIARELAPVIDHLIVH